MPELKETDNQIRFEQYRISSIRNVLLVIGLLGFLRVIYLIRGGYFSAAKFNDAEGLVTGGIIGHLLLLSYSLLPIVFLYWLEHKKEISYFIPVVLILGTTFASFIKYNVIGVVIGKGILYNHKELKKELSTIKEYRKEENG